MRLALELLDPEDRQLIVLRQWDNLEFNEIGEKMGLAPDAARMRFNRALPKLAMKVQQLQRGQIDEGVLGAPSAERL